MALTWQQSQFGTEYAFLGKIPVGAINWESSRGKGPDAESGYYFRSELFGAAPDIPTSGAVFADVEGAKKDAEDMAVAYADYIGRKVHGDEAWGRVTRGL